MQKRVIDKSDTSYYARNRERYATIRDASLERRITNPEDSLDAFAGIMRVISKEDDTDFIWGIPEREFANGLLWSMPNSPRTYAFSNTSSDRATAPPVRFPSCSWSAWQIPIEQYSTVFTATGVGALYRRAVAFYRISVDGRLCPINENAVERPRVGVPVVQPAWADHSGEIAPALSTADHKHLDPGQWVDSGLLQFWTSTSVAYITSSAQIHKLGLDGSGSGVTMRTYLPRAYRIRIPMLRSGGAYQRA